VRYRRSSTRLDFALLLAVVLSAAVSIASPADAVSPVALVDGSTTAFYNASLGRTLDGTGPQFPCANSVCGDPTVNPASEPDLSSASGKLGPWLTSSPPASGSWTGPQVIPATWGVNSETAIVYVVDGGSGGYRDVTASFGVDNGIFVWINGTYVFGAMAPGPAVAGEYVFSAGDLPPGQNLIQVLREDHGGGTGYNVTIRGTPNAAPDCSAVAADPNTLWPPNHKMVRATIDGATDPDADALTLEITGVTQDEPVAGPGSNHQPDATPADLPNAVDLRAERDGDGDGRVYQIAFTADDGLASCSVTALVSVPHDQSGDPAVDSGNGYDSTTV
jgi:hypothetical protein